MALATRHPARPLGRVRLFTHPWSAAVGALARSGSDLSALVRAVGGRVPQTTSRGIAMTKRAEAKYKIDRRMGQNIWGRPKSPFNRREYGPGQHGQRRKGKLSHFSP